MPNNSCKSQHFEIDRVEIFQGISLPETAHFPLYVLMVPVVMVHHSLHEYICCDKMLNINLTLILVSNGKYSPMYYMSL